MKQYKSAPKKVREEWQEKEGTEPVPEDLVWVCAACGKTSRTRFGFDKDNKRVCSGGWDESCMLNSVLCLNEKKEEPLIVES